MRFPPTLRIWAGLLVLVNLASLFFLNTLHGQLALAAALAGVVVIVAIYLRFGFVRLMGAAHVFWIPMLIWFAANIPDPVADPWLYRWVWSLLVMNTISLVVDALDVLRYLRGEREPHYTW